MKGSAADDDDDRITRLSNAENELQRKNCAPFLTQPPWGRHAFHGSPRILEKHRAAVNRTEVARGRRQGSMDLVPPSARRPGGMRFKRARRVRLQLDLSGSKNGPGSRLGHLWGAWHASYMGTRSIMVRYEDLLWRPLETVGAVCSCVGGMTSAAARRRPDSGLAVVVVYQE